MEGGCTSTAHKSNGFQKDVITKSGLEDLRIQLQARVSFFTGSDTCTLCFMPLVLA